MNQFLAYSQIALGLIIVVIVLLQPKGVGLGQVFGGEGNVYRTKRGAERIVFNATIVLALLFFAVSLALILI